MLAGVGCSSEFRDHPSPAWFSPHLGFYKLNFDGSVTGNLGPSGIGGIIKDSSGACMISFSGLVGSTQ